ncbi:hypothetical protein PENDEC_c016G05910 [Penicillium decumbens]|uniref:Altered inheritance of mitochondria protein 9, mitochondrial n=1 Tax=Penicillium decumbens TaxID=69771 RepID=A0A1V6P8J4_PENDC|nr:hypothetical protein PENDEC_c016G05910 [Penicillium decumbens]
MILVHRSHIFRLGQRARGHILPFKATCHHMPYSTDAPASPANQYDFDPYNYTGARWLRNDNQQRQLRYMNFDFSALSEKVLALSGAKSTTNCEKIEGGSHREFIYTFDNGNRTIARLPFKVAGPPSLTTASEVATIRYLQQRTNIPIPKVLDWSEDASNSIGSEYIISEYPVGTNLHWKWPDMTDDQRVKCIENIYRILKEVVDLEFPVYGNIYFANTLTYPTHVLDDEFCIGPHCGDRYWGCGTTKFYHHHGSPTREPWQDLLAYSNAQIDTGLARLPPINPDPDLYPQLSYQGSITQHIKLLQCARKALDAISTDPQLQTPSTPTLFPDLQKRNILVSESDPSIVIAILEWKQAAIEPAFWYANLVPDFAHRAAGRPIPNEPLQKGEDEEEYERDELCAKTYRNVMRV